MAHDIEENRFISTQSEWHKLGLVKEQITIQDAINQIHPELLVKVKLQGVLDDGSTMEAPESYGIYRTDGKYLGHTGERFESVQPIDTIGAYQSLLDTGLVNLETAGVLCDGKKIFVTAKVKDSAREIVKGDVVDLYFTIASGLCGNMTHRMFSCAQRTVCANTLRIAEKQGKKNSSMVQCKHTKSIHSKMDNWFESVERSLVQWEESVEGYKYLASKSITTPELKTYIDNVFEVDRTDEVSTKTENKVRYVIDLFDSGRGTELVPANYWRAYNAVTEYLTHDYGHNADNRMDSLMFGESSKVSQRALTLALEAY